MGVASKREIIKPEENIQAMEALKNYLSEHHFSLPENASFVYGLDYVEIRIDKTPVLIVNLPPVSNYTIEMTEYTDEFLRKASGD